MVVRFGAPDRPTQEQRAALIVEIDNFWSWWIAVGADAVASAVGSEIDSIVDPLNERIAQIDPFLGWEISAGRNSRHALIVSAEGSPPVRVIARKWLLAAPPANSLWSYADSRGPRPDLETATLSIDGANLVLSQTRVGLECNGSRYDAAVYHPAMLHLDQHDRGRLAFLALDAALGEDVVSTWIAAVEHLTEMPYDPLTLGQVRKRVDGLRTEFTNPDGGPRWISLRDDRDTDTRLIRTRVPLSPFDCPQLDEHVEVRVFYSEQDEQGQPPTAMGDKLHSFATAAQATLGAAGQLVADETAAGQRILHFYLDGAANVDGYLIEAATRWSHGRTDVRMEYDPAWTGVAHLRY